ncbi:MAG: IS66 family transposase [Sphaerochaetaceae bacterium]|jgi:transposase
MKENLVEQLKKMDHTALVNEYLSLLQYHQEQMIAFKELQEIHELKTALIYVPKTEQTAYLFDEVELLSEEPKEDEEIVIVKQHTRTKAQKLTTLDANTPVVTIVHEVEKAPSCSRCGETTIRVEDKVVEKVGVQPKQYYIEKHLFAQYSCPCCEAETSNGETNIITVWENPKTDKLIASSSLVADCATRKYSDSLPLYRQEMIFKREGFEVSRQTLSNWLMTYSQVLEPLRKRLKELILQSNLINQDETPVRVLKIPEAATSKSNFMLVQVGSTSSEDSPFKKLVLYTYLPNRRIETLQKQLEGFKGYVMTDGLKGYLHIEKHLNCWVHAQRQFKQILKVNPKASVAAKVVNIINELYTIEKQLRSSIKDRDEFLTTRREKCELIFDKLKTFMQEQRVNYSSKSAMGRAFSYLETYWSSLVAYVDCYEASPHNNYAELAIRPFTIGRKNWLFSNTVNGAASSALYYSLIETAKANSLNVYDYLWYCFAKGSTCKTQQDWDSLLPWNIDQREIASLKAQRALAKPDPNRTEPYILRGKR